MNAAAKRTMSVGLCIRVLARLGRSTCGSGSRACQGVSSFEPSEGADQMQAGEEIAGSFFVTGRDASELFDELKKRSMRLRSA